MFALLTLIALSSPDKNKVFVMRRQYLLLLDKLCASYFSAFCWLGAAFCF